MIVMYINTVMVWYITIKKYEHNYSNEIAEENIYGNEYKIR